MADNDIKPANPVEPTLQPDGVDTPGKPRSHHRWLRIILRTILAIIIFVILIPVLLYVPPVQTLVKNVACGIVRKSTGMDVAIDKLSLRWPLDVSLRGVKVIEASGDTMVMAKEVIADVKLLPLLKLDAQIKRLELLGAYYRMLSPDSSMLLKIRAGYLKVDDKSSANLAQSRILINEGLIRNGTVSLVMDVWKKKETPTDTSATPFFIQANALRLENFNFEMSMLPTIDTLNLHTALLTLDNGVIDLGKNLITASSMRAASGNVTYLTPTPEYIASHPAPPADTTAVATPPMVIRADTVSLSGFKALYAVKDGKPLPGFDPSYIQASGINITLHDFYNAASTITLPISSMQALERSGLRITEGHGKIGMDETGLQISGLEVKTPFSNVNLTAGLPFALMEMKPEAPLNVEADASIGMPDAEAFMPSLSPVTSRIPARSPLNLRLIATGTLSDAAIPQCDLNMPGVFSLEARGNAKNALDFNRLSGILDFKGTLTNPAVADNILGKVGFRMPSFSINGRATAANRVFGANFKLLTSVGDVAADGRVSMGAETYNADVALRKVNVAHFMPDLGIGRITADIKAKGAGFDPTRRGAKTEVSINVASIAYQKQLLKNITASATLLNGAFTLNARSDNPSAEFRLNGSGTIAPDNYTFDIDSRLSHIDLHALGITPTTNGGMADVKLTGSANPAKWTYDVTLGLNALRWTVGEQFFNIPGDLTARFVSTPEFVDARISGDKAEMKFNASSGLRQLMAAFTGVADSAAVQVEKRVIDINALTGQLPPFNLDVNAAGSGLLQRVLHPMGFRIDTVFAHIAKDSLLNGKAGIRALKTPSMQADTLDFLLSQRGPHLDYSAHLGTRANNPIAEFANVNLTGFLGGNQAKVGVVQKNQKGQTGYSLGVTATLADSTISLKFSPQDAMIAYLPWKFNKENHIDYNFLSRHITANLIAESKESSIHIVTQPNKAGRDELNLDISNLRIQDFLKLSIFAPPITAAVNAKLNLGYSKDWLYGRGNLSIGDFTYNKLRVGDFDLGFRAARNNDGTTGANLILKVDGDSAMFFRARVVPDSTGTLQPQRMGLRLQRFPLHIANPFLGPDVARLSGYLNGDMDMTGSFTAPKLSGYLECDSVGIFLPMMGSQLRLNQDSLSVVENVVRINNFDIWGANKNPIVINGSVDASHLSRVVCDLNLRGHNFQLIGNDKRARSEIYGKVFLDVDASAKGPIYLLDVKGKLGVLSGTDVTYSIPETTAQLTQTKAGDVVTFVNFSDTTSVAVQDTVPTGMSMRISASLSINPGVSVTVDIPGTATTGNGKVEINPYGTLSYFQNYMGDMKLNGQLNIGEGYARYSIPIVGEKKFSFTQGSYVLWNGDLMNPTLSISASDNIKANLLQNGNSRLVDFIVKLSVSNTLSAPKVLFDLSTEDDMSIRNDLMSMSADQRSMAAINLLLTGQYNAQGVKTASADLVTGAAYGLLTSQLNSFLANHVKGVDLTFGVDQYDKTVNGQTGTATSYSYQMSKSLFNNRFKISVGGNYTTDASADENFSENLISDISFEYILRQTANTTMFVKLFRHTGYESILEGEVVETGVGYVLRRRLSDLRELFKWVPIFRNDDSGGSPAPGAPAAGIPAKPAATINNNDSTPAPKK